MTVKIVFFAILLVLSHMQATDLNTGLGLLNKLFSKDTKINIPTLPSSN